MLPCARHETRNENPWLVSARFPRCVQQYDDDSQFRLGFLGVCTVRPFSIRFGWSAPEPRTGHHQGLRSVAAVAEDRRQQSQQRTEQDARRTVGGGTHVAKARFNQNELIGALR